jgi:FSR family fosmidomycin resistance protein-like MFS transporter
VTKTRLTNISADFSTARQQKTMNSSMDSTTVPSENPQKRGLKILGAISFSHFLNDMLQSLISAIYPQLKDTFSLSFTQIGLITLTYQLSASLLQPAVGLYTDRYPKPYSLAIGMGCTLTGLLALSVAPTYALLLIAVGLVGTGSSIFHPESSRVAICILYRVGGWYKRRQQQDRQRKKTQVSAQPEIRFGTVAWPMLILLVLIFSKFFYLASLNSYYIFYLIHKFGVSVKSGQVHLFVFLFGAALGTIMGGPIGDRIGRKRVIWGSILGVAPFTLLLPYVSLFWTGPLTFVIGMMLASAFPAIVVYAQELFPGKVGMVSGLFFGLAFGMAGVGAALLGRLADLRSIEYVYQLCSFLPLLGLAAAFLPDLGRKSDTA